jgi:hypothetical protein
MKLFGKKDEKLKSENNVKVLYFNTDNSFIEKELPVMEDGTVSYGNKTWIVANKQPYLGVSDSFMKKGKVEPYYILTSNTTFPVQIPMSRKVDASLSDKDNPLVLNELVNFRALKQMMNFTISKEGQASEGNKLVKFIIMGALLVGAYFVIRYVWLGAGQ